MQRPALPPPAGALGLAGLWALLETQHTLLRDGHADDLPALAAQMQQALVQVQRLAVTAPREQLLALRQQADLNASVLQRRLVATQAALAALGPHLPALAEAGRRSTYGAGGRQGLAAIPGRALGRA